VAGLPTEAKVEGILYVREEEKLARDVYLALWEQWQVPLFQNIARSEETHMQAVGTLIERYGLAGPAVGNPAGTFENEALQALYDQLLEQSDIAIDGEVVRDMDDLIVYLAETRVG